MRTQRRVLQRVLRLWVILYLVYILAETARDKMRTRGYILLVSSRSSRRHAGKSVPSQRKWECLECLASLSTILAQECECLHSCVLCLIHISPKVSPSTRDEDVSQALGLSTLGTDPQRPYPKSDRGRLGFLIFIRLRKKAKGKVIDLIVNRPFIAHLRLYIR